MFRRNDQLHWTIFRFRHQVLINSWNWLLKASIVSPEKMDLWNVWCFPHSCYPWFLLCKNAVLVRFRPEPPPLQVVQPHHWPVAGVGPASRESPLRIGFENIPSSSRTAPPLTFRTYRIEALSIVLKDETCPISINLNQYPNQYQSISKSIQINLQININQNPNQSPNQLRPTCPISISIQISPRWRFSVGTAAQRRSSLMHRRCLASNQGIGIKLHDVVDALHLECMGPWHVSQWRWLLLRMLNCML